MIPTGTPRKLEMKYLTLRPRLAPYTRVRHVGDPATPYETISYPWIDGKRILVNIRRVGDPTTMVTVDALGLESAP